MREAIGSHATTLSFCYKRCNRKSENLVRFGMPSFILPRRKESILKGKGILKKKYVYNIHYKFRNSIFDINCFKDILATFQNNIIPIYNPYIHTYIFTHTHIDTYIHMQTYVYNICKLPENRMGRKSFSLHSLKSADFDSIISEIAINLHLFIHG